MWISILCVPALLMVHVVQIQAPDPLAALSTDNPAVQKRIVDILNGYRRKVKPTARNMVQVSWNKEAAETALKWAKSCSLKHSIPSQRKMPECNCGENLFMSTHAASWEEAFKVFYDEEKDYEYGKGPKKENDVVGHYTQLVWYNSKWIGCAVTACPKERFKYFYVCHHCPAGNVNSLKYPYSSGDTCGDCPRDCNDGLCTNPCPNFNTLGNCNDLKGFCAGYKEVFDKCKGSCTCTTEII